MKEEKKKINSSRLNSKKERSTKGSYGSRARFFNGTMG
jgi:hypothetical protein